jgi:hypothetical protein
MASLEKQLVYGQSGIVNRDFEGEIREYGDRVYIHGIGEIAVADYTRDVTRLNYQLLDDARQELAITQSKYFAFRVDDADQAQQKPKVIDAASSKATRTLAEVADRYVAGFYTSAGQIMAASQITAENVYSRLVQAGVMLDEANVPTDGRYMIVPPWMAGRMLENDKFIVKAEPTAPKNGQIARVAGFDILKSNNVPMTPGDAATSTPDTWHVTAGHRVAISYAEQIAKVEGIRLQDSFADGVRGLHLYGAKVLEPSALLVMDCRR